MKRWFGRTVTHSDRRFTYEEAQEVIEIEEEPIETNEEISEEEITPPSAP